MYRFILIIKSCKLIFLSFSVMFILQPIRRFVQKVFYLQYIHIYMYMYGTFYMKT